MIIAWNQSLEISRVSATESIAIGYYTEWRTFSFSQFVSDTVLFGEGSHVQTWDLHGKIRAEQMAVESKIQFQDGSYVQTNR